MPDPRTIALKTIDKANLTPEGGYDAVAGCPVGVSPQQTERDYTVNPVNPPSRPAPAANLKR